MTGHSNLLYAAEINLLGGTRIPQSEAWKLSDAIKEAGLKPNEQKTIQNVPGIHVIDIQK
jgi:hypothetical protein